MTMPGTDGSSASEATSGTLTATDRRAPGDDAPVTPPATVTNAFYALMTALALTVINALVAVVSPPSTKDYADFIQGMHFPTDPAATNAAADAGDTAAMVNLVVIVAFVAIFVYFGRLMREGLAWARTVNVVLAVMGILGGVAVAITDAVLAPLPVAGGELGIGLLLLLAASLAVFLVLVFQKASIRFFAPPPCR